jgi:hypothetical protein
LPSKKCKKISEPKLNSKVQNINVKSLLKPKNTNIKPYFDNENEKKGLRKSSPKCHKFWPLIPQKIPLGLKKVAQMARLCPIWSHLWQSLL